MNDQPLAAHASFAATGPVHWYRPPAATTRDGTVLRQLPPQPRHLRLRQAFGWRRRVMAALSLLPGSPTTS